MGQKERKRRNQTKNTPRINLKHLPASKKVNSTAWAPATKNGNNQRRARKWNQRRKPGKDLMMRRRRRKLGSSQMMMRVRLKAEILSLPVTHLRMTVILILKCLRHWERKRNHKGIRRSISNQFNRELKWVSVLLRKICFHSRLHLRLCRINLLKIFLWSPKNWRISKVERIIISQI